jgi:hypothetical protein
MIDETMPSAASQLDRPSSLRLPLQAAPIDRSQSRTSAVTADGGVEAAAEWWETAIDIGSKIPWGSIFSDRTLKRDIMPVEWTL